MPKHTDNSTATSRRPVAMLALGETIVWSGLFYVFPALLLRWEKAFSWSKTELTGAITLALICSAFCSPLFGRLIDRGFGPVIMGCGALVGGSVLMCLTLASELWHFYAAWIVIGICFAACLYEPCFALLTRVYGAQAKSRIIVVTLVAGFASTISFPAAHFIADHLGLSAVVKIFASVVICCGAPLLYFGARAVENQSSSSTPNVTSVTTGESSIGRALFLQLAISFALLAVVHGAALHHMLHILGDRGLTLGASVFVATLIGPMQVFGRVVMTLFQKTLQHTWIAYGCFALVGVAMIFLFWSSAGLIVAVSFAVFFGSGYGMVSIIRPLIARDMLGDDNFGAKSGSLAFFYVLGTAAAPYFGSIVWSLGGYDALIAVLCLLVVCGVFLLHLAIRQAAKQR